MTPHGDGATPAVREHRHDAPATVRFAVVTVSDSRTEATDSGGAVASQSLERAGHRVLLRERVPDEVPAIREAVSRLLARADVDAIVLTGGTGVSPRDVTPEALDGVLEKTLPGFGELFRMLSFEEIGSAAMMSRALCGIAQGKPVWALPGSPAGVRLAVDRLVAPEAGHLLSVARRPAKDA